MFQVISIITTTGYSTENLGEWPVMLPIMAIFFPAWAAVSALPRAVSRRCA